MGVYKILKRKVALNEKLPEFLIREFKGDEED